MINFKNNKIKLNVNLLQQKKLNFERNGLIGHRKSLNDFSKKYSLLEGKTEGKKKLFLKVKNLKQIEIKSNKN